MRINRPQESATYVQPKWKIWPSFLVLVLVMLAGMVLGLFEEGVQKPIGFLLLVNVLQFAFFFLIPLYVAGVQYKQPLLVLGIQERPLTFGLGKSLLWGVLLLTFNVLTTMLLLILFPNQPQEVQPMMQALLQTNNALELGALVLCATVLAPVGEEIFFRAFLFGAVEARFGRLAGIIVSAAVFAVCHGDPWIFLPMFVGGVGFAMLYAKYRDISMNIIAHATWNSIAVIMTLAMYSNF